MRNNETAPAVLARVVTHVSELAMMLWLLIRGLNVELWEKRTIAHSANI